VSAREMCILAACLAATAGTVPAGAATVWFVRDSAPPGGNGLSFASAFTSLDTALAASTGGDEIRVAAGRYVPGSPGGRASSFVLKPGVSLYGGFVGNDDAFNSRDPLTYPTVLSGDRAGDDEPGWENRSDNCYRVLIADDPVISASTVLDGFVITGGQADGAALSGGGFLVLNCEPTVRACTFIENLAGSPTQSGAGGAVSIEGTGAARVPRFESCRFERNQGSAGGAVRVTGEGADIRLVRCDFVSNVGQVGGAVSVEAPAYIVSCRFFSNGAVLGKGGAVRAAGGAQVWIVNSVLDSNTASEEGGALSIECCTAARVINCTVVGNYAGIRAGGVRLGTGATVEVTHSILYENSDSLGLGESAQISGAPGIASLVVTSCLVSGWTGALGGTGNFDGAPLFADASGADAIPGTDDDDFRLTAGSLCIDAGQAGLLPADATDLDNDADTGEALPLDLADAPRTLDGDFDNVLRPDLGAYEFHCPSDFDLDTFVNGADFDAFALAFEAGDNTADFNRNGFVNGEDFDGFVIAFEAGC